MNEGIEKVLQTTKFELAINERNFYTAQREERTALMLRYLEETNHYLAERQIVIPQGEKEISKTMFLIKMHSPPGNNNNNTITNNNSFVMNSTNRSTTEAKKGLSTPSDNSSNNTNNNNNNRINTVEKERPNHTILLEALAARANAADNNNNNNAIPVTALNSGNLINNNNNNTTNNPSSPEDGSSVTSPSDHALNYTHHSNTSKMKSTVNKHNSAVTSSPGISVLKRVLSISGKSGSVAPPVSNSNSNHPHHTTVNSVSLSSSTQGALPLSNSQTEEPPAQHNTNLSHNTNNKRSSSIGVPLGAFSDDGSGAASMSPTLLSPTGGSDAGHSNNNNNNSNNNNNANFVSDPNPHRALDQDNGTSPVFNILVRGGNESVSSSHNLTLLRNTAGSTASGAKPSLHTGTGPASLLEVIHQHKKKEQTEPISNPIVPGSGKSTLHSGGNSNSTSHCKTSDLQMSGGSATKETDRSDSSGGKKDGGDIHNKSYKGDIIARMRRIMFEDPEPTAERFQSNANKNFATHLHYDSEYNRKEETYSTRTNQGESREDNTNSNSLKKDSSEDADHPKNNTMRHDGSGSSEFSRGNSPTSLAQFAFLNSDAILRPAKKVEETEKNPPHNNNNNIVNPIQKEEAEDTIRTGGVFDATVNRFISSLVLNASDGSDSHHHQHRLSNNFSPTHSSVVAFPTSPAGIAFHQQSHSMDSTKGKGKPERTKVPTLSRAGVPAQQNDNTYFRKLQHNTTET